MNENEVQSIELTHAELLVVTAILEVAIKANPVLACYNQLVSAAARLSSTAYPVAETVQIKAQGY
jgi:hypothetical protein